MKKILMLVTSLCLTATLLVGCGQQANEVRGEETGNKVASAVKDDESHYPVTITTYNYAGEEVETVYDKAPEKVLAVYQGSIETMLALGLEDHIVAAAGLDNEVDASMKEAFDGLNYMTEFTPSKENILMLEPDMILSWGSIFSDKKLGDIDYWIGNGTNTYINTNTRSGKNSRTLENEYTDILNLGKIFNVEDKAETIVAGMKKEIEDVKAKTTALEKKPTALIVEFNKDNITNYGETTLGGDMVKNLGGEILKKDGKDIGKEDIINLNPDVIFVVYMPYKGDNPEQVKQDKLNKILEEEAFASLSAVQNAKVIPIMLGDMYASGVRTQNGIVDFAKGLYPELY